MILTTVIVESISSEDRESNFHCNYDFESGFFTLRVLQYAKVYLLCALDSM